MGGATVKRKFWQWVHDRLEEVWRWVYRTKLAEPIKPSQDVMYSYTPLPGINWPKIGEVERVDYYRVNPDGTYTLLDGPTDTAVIG